MRKNNLAAKVALLSVAIATIPLMPVHAGIPTVDVANIVQTSITALEAMAQTAQQIEQYQTQMMQYEDQIRHSLAPVSSVWDAAQDTMDKLVAAQNTLAYYENQLGSLDRYLEKYQDVEYYRNSPCFTAVGCSSAERAAMHENRVMASESQKKANDALFTTISAHQKSLKADAQTLEKLQRAAQSAEGQLQAIGYANQLASNQTNQLLQMRSLMTAQQAADATRHAAEMDAEAKSEAAAAQMRDWTFKKSDAGRY